MRVIYLDCFSGISGDMMLGALLDLGAPLDRIMQGLESLGLPDARLETSTVSRKGFRAAKIDVVHGEQHAHRHLSDILERIANSRLTPQQQDLARRLFVRLGEAEARVHGVPVERVHFHEVGAIDSIFDIVGTAIAWDWLAPEHVVASPVPLGEGTIRIAHGQVRLPAPATAELLKGMPIRPTSVAAELTTPTGATFLAELVDEFGSLPPMTVNAVGYGAGDRELEEQPNLLRIFSGEFNPERMTSTDWVDVLETQVDDQPAEWLGYLMERLLAVGALDVYFTPIQMKKSRPGTLVTVIAEPSSRVEIEAVLFAESTTTGIRIGHCARSKLSRQTGEVATPWGQIEGKWIVLPGGARRFVPEFDSCRRTAMEQGVPLPDVYRAALAAASLSSAD